MLSFLTEPAPHEEAAALIADKPAVLRELFDSLPDEMKSRAFTIKGIEDFDILQSVRDQISKIPQGADWDHVKQDIIRKMSPWLDETQAATRAELLMRFHAGQAYATTSARIADSMIDVFPFRQYHTNHGPRVRDSHAALDGLILPADHEFWKTHTPPWQFNCHCFFTTLTEEDRDEAHAREQGRPPEARNVLEGPALDALAAGRVSRGPSQNYTLGKSIFHVDATTLPYDQIKKRWDTATAADFEAWADKQDMGSGRSLLKILQDGSAFREDPLPGGTGKVIKSFVDEAQALATFQAVRVGAEMLSASLPTARREALRAWEAQYAMAAVEHGLLLDKEGVELGRTIGTRDSVSLPENQPTAGNLFSHNHPARSSFSPQDLKLLFAHRLGELRVTNLQGSYSISRRPPHALGEVLARMTEVGDDMIASIATLEISTGEQERLLQHAVWTRLAREGLINYHFTPMRPDSPLSESLSAQPAPVPGFMERYGWDKLQEEVQKNPEQYAYTDEELKAED